MKKIFILIVLLCGVMYANEFDWHTYESICFEKGVEPSWEEYVHLCENPQGYYLHDEDENELEKLLNEKTVD